MLKSTNSNLYYYDYSVKPKLVGTVIKNNCTTMKCYIGDILHKYCDGKSATKKNFSKKKNP